MQSVPFCIHRTPCDGPPPDLRDHWSLLCHQQRQTTPPQSDKTHPAGKKNTKKTNKLNKT